MRRVILVYESEDLHMKFRQEISELFLIIAKNIGLRKIFLNKALHEMLVRNSLAFLDQKQMVKVSAQMLEVYQNAIKLLCLVCTARKTQFYIPGETNLSERLRKRAFDSGTFTLLTYLYNELKDIKENPFKAIREHIQHQILNYETVTDLAYHSRLLKFLKDNPHLTRTDSELKLNADSTFEESKDTGLGVQPQTEDVRMTANVSDQLASPNGKKESAPIEKVSASKYSSNIVGSYQTSPRMGTSKGRSVKKASSTMINFNSQSQASATIG